jgi:predicted DCC family thiol-disulfide oxidoreductase YuxK
MAESILVYDGDCAFCTSCARFVERRMKRHPKIVAWQLSDLAALGLTQDECELAVQWIGADGKRASAQHAIGYTLVNAGRGWMVFGRILLLPGISHVAGFVYRLIARNRHRMPGGTPECSMPQSERGK